MKLSNSQITHGEQQLEEIAQRWHVEKPVVVRILLDVKTIKLFWSWVNADDFLLDKEVEYDNARAAIARATGTNS